jgi:hypothetical protein
LLVDGPCAINKYIYKWLRTWSMRKVVERKYKFEESEVEMARDGDSKSVPLVKTWAGQYGF